MRYTYCACLFYCLGQLMHMVIYLLDLLTIFQVKITDGDLLPRENRKVLAQLRSSGKKKQGFI